jgi:fluoride exporter
MKSFILVALGAALGGVMRHGVNLAAARFFGAAYPWGTLCVNVIGGFLMGLLAGGLLLKVQAANTQDLRLFLGTGLLGGFTTFSAFSLDAVGMIERGAWKEALLYMVLSVALSVCALYGGLALMRGV